MSTRKRAGRLTRAPGRAHEDLEPRHELERARVLDGRGRVLPPRERAVLPHQHGGEVVGRQAALAERLDDHAAGVPLVLARHLAPVSARVTGTSPRKWSACVVPRQRTGSPAWASAVAFSECVCTMPPHGERAVELEVRRRVRGRAAGPADHLAGRERDRHESAGVSFA